MDCLEIKAELEKKGYYVSPNYGLIMEKSNPEEVIADIRKFEEKVVLPYWNEVDTVQVKNLRKILIKEKISFRDDRQAAA